MTLNSFIRGALSAAAITMAGSFVQAQQAGGSLVFLVQPEPPTMAGYVSTSGPIGLLGPKIYDGLVDYDNDGKICLLYTSPSPRDATLSRMPSSA